MGHLRAVAFACLGLGVGCGFNAGGSAGKPPAGDDQPVADAPGTSVDAPPPPISCGELTCDPHAVCTEASGSTPASCACPSGYLDENGDGSACSDIDECAMTPSPCIGQGKAACENTSGGYSCYTPAKCQDAKDHHVPDGETTLYAGGDLGKPWRAICDNGDDYLALANPATNFSRYAKSSQFDADVVTTFQGVRIDPGTFVVDIADTKHATSTGQTFLYGRTVKALFYGTATDCSNDNQADGTGNLDLTGTAFRVAAGMQWVVQGDRGGGPQHRDSPAGTATASSDNQVVALTGGGDCGWVAPAPGVTTPFASTASTKILKLEYRAPVTP